MSTNVAKYTNSPLVGAFSLLRSSLSRFPRASLPFDKVSFSPQPQTPALPTSLLLSTPAKWTCP